MRRDFRNIIVRQRNDPTFHHPSCCNESESIRATDTMQARKPSAAGRLTGDFRRAILACGFALAFCLVVAVIASWVQASVNTAARSRAASEGGLSTGSMLFVSPTGNLCRQSTIDNSTWRIRNNGLVDCEEALAKSANAGVDGRTPGSRLELIRQGFAGKP
jgi:hypothetical protein